MSSYMLDGCPGCPTCHVDHNCEDCGKIHGAWSWHERDYRRRLETLAETVLLVDELRAVLARWQNLDGETLADVLDTLAREVET